MADNDPENDLINAVAVLVGYVSEGADGIHHTIYMGKGTKNYEDACLAIARLLRSESPPRKLLNLLADVFDPNSHTVQKTELKRRRRGPPPDPIQSVIIVSRMYGAMRAGATVEAAAEEIAAELSAGGHKITADGVKKHWRQARRSGAKPAKGT